MADDRDQRESEIARILKTNYEDIEMSNAYRLEIQQKTREAFSRRRPRVLQWVLGSVGALAVVWTVVLLLGPVMQKTAPFTVPAMGPAPAGVYSGADHAPGAVVAIASVKGSVTDGKGRALNSGDRLSVGDEIRTGKGALVTLVMRKGSEIGLNENTRIALKPDGTLDLRSGEVFCANRDHEIAQIGTEVGRVHLLGTTINAAVQASKSVAVTVVEGKVRLANSHGEAVVPAGKQAVLTAHRAPGGGMPVNAVSATAWYEGRNAIASDFGEIVYSVERHGSLASEIWVMNSDGSGKRLLKTYAGYQADTGQWFPGARRLLVNSHTIICGKLDYENRCADSNSGGTIVSQRTWVLNTATGQDTAFALPDGYNPIYTAMSPDCTRLAFCGYLRAPLPEGGVWTYEIRTGEIRKIADGYIKNPVVWSPDSRYLAFSEGEGYGTDHPLVIADTRTGQVHKLDIEGAGPSFSPDGTKLAYCGGFAKGGRWEKGGSWFRGVPVSGSVFVVDIASGSTRRITAEGEGSLEPRWSPDGTRIAYMIMRDKTEDGDGKSHSVSTLYVMNADGSDRREAISVDGHPKAWSWTPSVKALYVATNSHHDTGRTLVVSADGKGILASLGGTAEDSILTPQQKADMDGAIAVLREAAFRYAVGIQLCEYKKASEAAPEFRAAADLFRGVVWRYPQAGFGNADLQAYADAALKRAEACGRTNR